MRGGKGTTEQLLEWRLQDAAEDLRRQREHQEKKDAEKRRVEFRRDEPEEWAYGVYQDAVANLMQARSPRTAFELYGNVWALLDLAEATAKEGDLVAQQCGFKSMKAFTKHVHDNGGEADTRVWF
jgi:hypothetical protein